jgi:hypothetical protein
MKIDEKKIKHTAELFEKIQKLQKGISKIENLAQFVSDNDVKGKLDLSIGPDFLKNTIVKVEGSFDFSQDYMARVLLENHPYPTAFGRFKTTNTKKNDNDKNLSDELSETATMQILGILLCEKQKKLSLLIDELKENGIFIEK